MSNPSCSGSTEATACGMLVFGNDLEAWIQNGGKVDVLNKWLNWQSVSLSWQVWPTSFTRESRLLFSFKFLQRITFFFVLTVMSDSQSLFSVKITGHLASSVKYRKSITFFENIYSHFFWLIFLLTDEECSEYRKSIDAISVKHRPPIVFYRNFKIGWRKLLSNIEGQLMLLRSNIDR